MNEDWATGSDLYRAERYEEAVPYLQRAAQATDAEGGSAVRGPAYNHLGMAQYVLGRYDEAVATFRAAILQTPGKARLHYNLGNSLLAVGRLADARRQYELALDLDPEYDEAKRALIVVAAEIQAPTPSAERPSVAPPSFKPAPSPFLPPAPPPDRNDTEPVFARIEALAAQARDAREAVQDTRRLLQQQEQAERALMDELLGLVQTYAAEREEAVREAALQRAQTLLSEAVKGLSARHGG